jgi:predicted NUDIX family NTP pyrophosphohydrolase
MKKLSAGVLLFRRTGPELQVLLVHPGGPFWAKKDSGAWTIPKGEYRAPEESLAAAQREFEEETGFAAEGDFISLGELKQPGGKLISAWALEKDIDATQIKSNAFDLEWPPQSKRIQQFPEVDRGAWFTLEEAREKLTRGQLEFLTRLEAAT